MAEDGHGEGGGHAEGHHPWWLELAHAWHIPEAVHAGYENIHHFFGHGEHAAHGAEAAAHGAEAVAHGPAPAPVEVPTAPRAPLAAGPPLREPITGDMAQMVEDLRAHGIIPEAAPAPPPAPAPLREPITGDMAQMVEDIQRAQAADAAALDAARAARAGTAGEAAATASAATEAGEAANAAHAAGGVSAFGRVMGGAGALAGGVQAYQGISELAHGNYENGLIDTGAGALGVGAGLGGMLGTGILGEGALALAMTNPITAGLAAGAGLFAAGHHYTADHEWWGTHRDAAGRKVNNTSFDFIGNTTSGAFHGTHDAVSDFLGGGTLGEIGGDVLGGVAGAGAAVGSTIVGVGGDILGGVLGAGEAIGSGISSAASWIASLGW